MPHKTPELRRAYYEKTKNERNRKRRERAATDPDRDSKRAKILEYQKAYREGNKERIKEICRQWREKNRNELLAKKRAYHHANKERENKKSIAWHAANTKYANQKNREAYAKDKIERLSKLKELRKADPSILIREREYRKSRPEASRKYRRDYYWRNKSDTAKTYRLASVVTRNCARCETPFSTDDGRRIYCTADCCAKESTRLWALRNAHRVRWIKKNRAKLLEDASHYTKTDWESVLEYYQHSCAYCGRSDVPLQVEHIIPIIRHGDNTAYNICPACEKCNLTKHSHTLIEFMFFRAIGFKLPDRGKRKKKADRDEGASAK